MYKLYFDGGSNPNPGKTAGAYVIYQDDTVIAQGGKFLAKGTNNIGEYTGLVEGLKRSLSLNIKEIEVFGDSMLVISQLNGSWKVRNEGLKPYYAEAFHLKSQFQKITLQHVLRHKNSYADSLSDKTLSINNNWEL